MASYLEHMALKVSDIEWHVMFFEEVFDMPVRRTLGEAPNRKIWLHAGIQLNEETDFENVEGRADHLGIMTDNVEEVLEKAYALGVEELPQGITGSNFQAVSTSEVIGAKNDVLHEILEKNLG
ncbi:MAG: VOC family protein [Anaerostipes hadrus]